MDSMLIQKPAACLHAGIHGYRNGFQIIVTKIKRRTVHILISPDL